MKARDDRDLEDLLRRQALLPLPPTLMGHILDEVLPAEPLRPWALACRAAAAAVIFLASWLAFAGNVPALADAAPPAHVTAGLPRAPTLQTTTSWGGAQGSTSGAGFWLAAGAFLLAGGLVGSWRLHARSATRGGTA